jgi:NAD(P)-dependent dehydrogenase (short-subunit alcohol dehydrogenase family)
MEADAPADFAPRFPGACGLKDRVGLVSGGSSGIGRATALLFGREGTRVTVPWHSDEPAAAEVADLIRADGGAALTLPLDAAALHRRQRGGRRGFLRDPRGPAAAGLRG